MAEGATKTQKIVHVPGIGTIAFPGGMADDAVVQHIQAHKRQGTGNREQGTVTPGATAPLDPRLAAVQAQFPRLAPYLSNVNIQQGQKAAGDDRGLEFYPPWESRNPNPGKITLELFDKLEGPALTTALGGDLLHYMGAKDPKTGQPIDPNYYAMKQAVLKARTPQQDALDRRVYAEAQRNEGEKRSYGDWLQQSRIDAYIRGYVTPELGGRYPDEWRKQGQYNAPAMKDAVEKIRQYVTGPVTPPGVGALKAGVPSRFGGVTTEESEHARQVKPAQPLSSALPHLPAWVTTPVVPKVKAWEDAHLPAARAIDTYNAQQAQAFDQAHPVAGGMMQGAANVALGLTSPQNVALAIAAPESKLLSALFSVQALSGAYKDATAARQAYLQGNNKEAARYATEAALGTGMAGAAGAHALSDVPVPAPVKDFLGNEEGSLTYKAPDQDEPFFLKSEKLLTDKVKGPMPAPDVHKMLLANGVSPEELKWTGMDEFLKGKGSGKVTPEELAQHAAENDVRIEEVQKGNEGKEPPDVDPMSLNVRMEGGHARAINPLTGQEHSVPLGYVDSSEDAAENLARRMTTENHNNWVRGERQNEPKYGSYVLPGGENYRELLVTMPDMGEAPEWVASLQKQYAEAIDRAGALRTRVEETGHQGPDADRLMQEMKAARNEASGLYTQLNAWKSKRAEGVFRTNHWNEPNILGHVRFNDRTQLTYTPQDIQRIEPNIMDAVGAKSADHLGSGAPAVAVRKGVITPTEAAQYSHAKGFRNDTTGAVRKILHLEELQSDWHQKGRAQGYSDQDAAAVAKDKEEFARLEDGSYHRLRAASDALTHYGDLGYDSQTEARSAVLTNPDWAQRWGVTSPRDIEVINAYRDGKLRMDELSHKLAETKQSVPDAPFKKNWDELFMKRMMRYAAQHGYDGISWTPGDAQAERYDLSKQVKEMFYYPPTQRLIAYDHAGTRVLNEVIPPEKLPDTIGKEAAQKLLAAPPLVNRSAEDTADQIRDLEKRRSRLPLEHTPESLETLRKINRELERLERKNGMATEHYLGGVDLKIGSKGMKGFYDKILPEAANKLAKPFGSRVEQTQLYGATGDTGERWARGMEDPLVSEFKDEVYRDPEYAFTKSDFARWLADNGIAGGRLQVPYLPVTPAMKALTQSLFGSGTAPAAPKALKDLREEAGRHYLPASEMKNDPPEAELPPELQRVRDAVQARYKMGQPRQGSYKDPAIASVGEHEPRTIEINDPAKFRQSPLQVAGHELIHLWRNNLPGPLQKAALPDDPKKPYDISNIDQLRSKGYTLATIPQEQAATIVQTYVADPSKRKQLQVWMNDLNNTPLSLENATEPGQKGINTTPRAPSPPAESYVSGTGAKTAVVKATPVALREQARRRMLTAQR